MCLKGGVLWVRSDWEVCVYWLYGWTASGTTSFLLLLYYWSVRSDWDMCLLTVWLDCLWHCLLSITTTGQVRTDNFVTCVCWPFGWSLFLALSVVYYNCWSSEDWQLCDMCLLTVLLNCLCRCLFSILLLVSEKLEWLCDMCLLTVWLDCLWHCLFSITYYYLSVVISDCVTCVCWPFGWTAPGTACFQNVVGDGVEGIVTMSVLATVRSVSVVNDKTARTDVDSLFVHISLHLLVCLYVDCVYMWCLCDDWLLYAHQASLYRMILQSLCVSHKIVETYRNQHAQKFSKRENGNEAPVAALTSLISGCDNLWEQD
jgi:hypothetical protein